MSSDRQSDRHGHHPDGFAEFTEELRLLAEVLLARVEPVLRRTAADGQADLGGCAWCPVCAAAALVRGEHHDVVAALADHGTAMVTVLREALAGVPVEPVLPPEWAEWAAEHPGAPMPPPHPAHPETGTATAGPDEQAARAPHATAPTRHRPDDPHPASAPPHPGATFRATADPGAAATADSGAASTTSGSAATTGSGATGDPGATADPGTGSTRRARWGGARTTQPSTPRPRRVDEYPAPRPQSTGPNPVDPGTPRTGGQTAPHTGRTTDAEDTARRRRPAEPDRSTAARAPRSRYVDIPVTIRG